MTTENNRKKVDTLLEWCWEFAFGSTIAYFVTQLPFLKNLPVTLSVAAACASIAIFTFIIRGIFRLSLKVHVVNQIRQRITAKYYKIIAGRKYTVEERSTERYKKAIIEQMKKSDRMYFRLVSGHTMYYDDREKFIIDALRDNFPVGVLDKKDIRIQLLDRSTDAFITRARDFVRLMNENELTCSDDEYTNRCEFVIKDLERIVGSGKINFYTRKHLWRLHIFDDIMFVSTYSDAPLIEGHLAPAYAFPKDCVASIFEGFLNEFMSLYSKAEPKEAEPASETAPF